VDLYLAEAELLLRKNMSNESSEDMESDFDLFVTRIAKRYDIGEKGYLNKEEFQRMEK
jgi:hypothetical protein